ncbi:MAG: hypothetical protein U0P82_12125 [Vicinamibacterales bacterium]
MRAFVLALALGCAARAASANTISIGLLTYDEGVLQGGGNAFDITNLSGSSALPPDYPVTTPVTITVTSLVASYSNAGGGSLTIPGSNFIADPTGNVTCGVAGDASLGGCNIGAYTITSATLTGTFSPVTGLGGLPPGFGGILGPFSATITPAAGAFLVPGDFAVVDATLVAATDVPVPEPSSGVLLDIGCIGLLAAWHVDRSRLLRRAESTTL